MAFLRAATSELLLTFGADKSFCSAYLITSVSHMTAVAVVMELTFAEALSSACFICSAVPCVSVKVMHASF